MPPDTLNAVFAKQPGSQEIATQFAIEHLQRWLELQMPTKVVEIGAGIGTLSYVLAEYARQTNAIIWSIEDNPWCRTAWRENLGRLADYISLVQVFPYESCELLVLDGDQMPDDGWACLAPHATVFVEGNRRHQRTRLRQYLKNVGRPFCETPSRPRDRSKGIWVIRVEPTYPERILFILNCWEQWCRDIPARLKGLPIGKKVSE